jgi:hypothetical protein
MFNNDTNIHNPDQDVDQSVISKAQASISNNKGVIIKRRGLLLPIIVILLLASILSLIIFISRSTNKSNAIPREAKETAKNLGEDEPKNEESLSEFPSEIHGTGLLLLVTDSEGNLIEKPEVRIEVYSKNKDIRQTFTSFILDENPGLELIFPPMFGQDQESMLVVYKDGYQEAESKLNSEDFYEKLLDPTKDVVSDKVEQSVEIPPYLKDRMLDLAEDKDAAVLRIITLNKTSLTN